MKEREEAGQQTGRRADDREADEEDVGLGVRERAETVVILLTGSIPETQVDGLAVDHHVGAVVVKHSRDVLAVVGEGGGSTPSRHIGWTKR